MRVTAALSLLLLALLVFAAGDALLVSRSKVERGRDRCVNLEIGYLRQLRGSVNSV